MPYAVVDYADVHAALLSLGDSEALPASEGNLYEEADEISSLPALPPAREGFTRYAIAGKKYSCAGCSWILGSHSETNASDKEQAASSFQHEVWASFCGHVYCGVCWANYNNEQSCQRRCVVCGDILYEDMIRVHWPSSH